MAAINVLVVGDGPFMTQDPPKYGISFLPSQDLTDNTFTVAEFLHLLRNNTVAGISVDTAHRRDDPNATFPNFNFATSVNLSKYDVLWLFGYEGWNYETNPYGSAIGSDELAAIATFMAAGRGVFSVGDHAGMGSLMCGQIPRVRSMRNWFGRPGDIPPGCPTSAINCSGLVVSAVNSPGRSGEPVPGVGRSDTLQRNPADTGASFEFDNQSDAIPQLLSFPRTTVHPILKGEKGPINRYPDHMHEGEVVTPASLSETVTINGAPFVEYPSIGAFQPKPSIEATGSIVGGHATDVESTAVTCEQGNFTGDGALTVAANIGTLCVYDGRGVGAGRVVTDSSFHHFLDLNLIGDPCGSTVDRKEGFAAGLVNANHDPVTPAVGGILADLQSFYVNTVVWLARADPDYPPPFMNNSIYGTAWDATSGWASSWYDVPGGPTANPGSPVTAIARNPNHLDLFVTATNSQIYSTYWDAASGWAGGWFDVPGGGAANPGSQVTAIARNPDHLDLFVTGTDGQVYSTNWDAATSWAGGWFEVPGGAATIAGSTVTVVSRTPDHLDLFITNQAGSILSTYWDAATSWAGGWFAVPGGGAAYPGSPVTVIARNPDHLDLFLIGTDSQIHSTYWDAATSWAAGWFAVPGGITANLGSTVTVVARDADHLDLFITNQAGSILSTYWDAASSWAGSWFDVPGALTANPTSTVTAIARNPNHLDLFVTGSDGQIHSTYWDAASSWASGWFDVPGGGPAVPGSTVTAIARNPDVLDLFVTG
jgi:hypothetical protein